MKLNCDMGESFGHYKLGNDAGVMPHIHMANIACGFHAGDPSVMEETVLSAKKSDCRCNRQGIEISNRFSLCPWGYGGRSEPNCKN